jgi:two-component system, chemotaxis family, sensor kinase CheA
MDIIRSFLSEADELLSDINRDILKLEAEPDNREGLQQIFRAAHTMKGSANLYGFSGVALVTHLLESILDGLREETIHMNPALADVLLEGFDQAKELVAKIAGGEEDPLPDNALLLRLREHIRQDFNEPFGLETEEAPTESTGTDSDGWRKSLRRYLAGERIVEERSFLQFVAEDETEAGQSEEQLSKKGKEALKPLRKLAGELLRKRSPVMSVLPVLNEVEKLLLEVEHAAYEEPVTGARLRNLAACIIILSHYLSTPERQAAEAGPDWWEEALTGWRNACLELLEGKSCSVYSDLILDIWELCAVEPDAKEAMHPSGVLLPPPVLEESWLPHDLFLPDDCAELEPPAAASTDRSNRSDSTARTEAPSLPCSEEQMSLARKLIVEQMRYLAPKGSPMKERWDLARSIWARCAAKLGDAVLLELARLASPDMAALKSKINEYAGMSGEDLSGGDGALYKQNLQPEKPVPQQSKIHPEGLNEDWNHDKVIRIEQGKIDRLLELAGELVIAKNALPYSIEKCSDPVLSRELKERFGVLDRVARELQDAILDVRMLPLSHVFSKFNRYVRDMAKQSNKHIRVEIAGEDTTLDKTLVESLSDPLIHIIRNSIDHGFESPEIRKAQGKPAEGLLRLHAWREGNRVFVEVRDDGKGIDCERIRTKIIEQGLMSVEDAAFLSREELLPYIYQAGFTTSDSVNSMSGRGMGMEAVQFGIRQLHGAMSVWSEPGEGTSVCIQLPLALTMTQILQVTAGDRSYGIPMDQIQETVRIGPEELHTVQGQRVMVLRGRVTTVLELGSRLGLGGSPLGKEYHYMVILKNGLALEVDSFKGQQEVVVKPLEGRLSQLPYWSGAAILGDGEVLLILSAGGLAAASARV